MAVNKAHDEFHAVDMTSGWEVPPGYPPGIEQKILSGGLDEAAKRGSRTRLLRFAPGVFTTAPFVHDYWEEVYLMSGDLTVGNDAEGRGGEVAIAAGDVAPDRGVGLVEHGGLLVTVFSAPNYCDQMGNKGAFIHFGEVCA